VLKLEIQNSPQFKIVRCSGRIVKEDGVEALVRAVTSEDKRHIMIDLNEVSAIDAAGLGALAGLEQWARDGNRTIHLANPSKRVREALETTGLSSVIQIVPAAPPRARHNAA